MAGSRMRISIFKSGTDFQIRVSSFSSRDVKRLREKLNIDPAVSALNRMDAYEDLRGDDFFELKSAKGKADSPNMTITQAVADWREINAGRLNPQMAFMSGKIKISGDMSLAMKLGSLMG